MVPSMYTRLLESAMMSTFTIHTTQTYPDRKDKPRSQSSPPSTFFNKGSHECPVQRWNGAHMLQAPVADYSILRQLDATDCADTILSLHEHSPLGPGSLHD